MPEIIAAIYFVTKVGMQCIEILKYVADKVPTKLTFVTKLIVELLIESTAVRKKCVHFTNVIYPTFRK